MNITTIYSRNISELIEQRPLMPLGAGTPDPSVAEKLDNAMLERIFGSAIIVNKTAARLCVAGLWLLYDHLEECHTIAQSIETPDGSCWHAIMHRREGDFSNSKYWYRRVGEHAIFPDLLADAKKSMPGKFQSDQWDPLLFVDFCEDAVSVNEKLVLPCQNIQQAEWKLLFEHCYSKAIE
jgi:hypothetical protein